MSLEGGRSSPVPPCRSSGRWSSSRSATVVALPRWQQASIFPWAPCSEGFGRTGSIARRFLAPRARNRPSCAQLDDCIAELETELATVKRASELFAQGQVVPPMARCPIVEALAREGHGTKRACRILGVAVHHVLLLEKSPGTARAIRRAWLTDAYRGHPGQRGAGPCRRRRGTSPGARSWPPGRSRPGCLGRRAPRAQQPALAATQPADQSPHGGACRRTQV